VRIASLLLVLAVAKAFALVGHDVPYTWWAPIAYLWQDAAVVLVFACIDAIPAVSGPSAGSGPSRATSRDGFGRTVCGSSRTIYAVLVLYVALNVPVTRVLSTSLTWSMWRAARGPLSDSIWQYATWQHALSLVFVLAVAAIAPAILRSVSRVPIVAGSIALVALGPLASSRVDTRGFERNAWTALVATAIPRASVPAPADWSVTGMEQAVDEDLTRFRGAAAGRNVVLVSLESTAAQYLGLFGAVPDPMPNLSALARSAIVFDSAYAAYPESIKGLFSILCSSYPALDSAAEAYAAVPCASMAAALGAGGYRTSLFHSGRFAYLGMDAIIRGRGYDRLVDAGEIGGEHDSSFGVDEPSTVAGILKWIDGLPSAQRFFVTYLPIAGHHPYETPEPGPFPEHDEAGRYRNALHYGDASLGALIRGLRLRGLEENTLWIVLGDHGEAFGQHDGNYGHTFQVFEENVHVPLLVAAPGLIPRQLRSHQVASLIDAAPTILDLLGEPAPALYQGRSLLTSEARMALFFADYSLVWVGLRDGRFKFVYPLDGGRSMLFDLDRDPHERIDLSREHPDRARWYALQLRGWSAAQSRRLMMEKE
jgi:hypothetical protein